MRTFKNKSENSEQPSYSKFEFAVVIVNTHKNSVEASTVETAFTQIQIFARLEITFVYIDRWAAEPANTLMNVNINITLTADASASRDVISITGSDDVTRERLKVGSWVLQSGLPISLTTHSGPLNQQR